MLGFIFLNTKDFRLTRLELDDVLRKAFQLYTCNRDPSRTDYIEFHPPPLTVFVNWRLRLLRVRRVRHQKECQKYKATANLNKAGPPYF